MFKHDSDYRFQQALWLLLAAYLVTGLAQAQVVRPFDERASFDDQGNIVLIGNVLVTCEAGTGSPVCEDVQDGSASGSNNRPMQYVNSDPGAGFDNSSSADLMLPPDATVLYAGLYWGGRADPGDADRGVLQLRAPGAATYQQITATQVDTISVQGTDTTRPFQAFAEVTGLVQTAGNGSYFAGDLAASLGQDGLGFYGGWSLVVIYRDVGEPFRRLSLYDGAANVAGTNSISVNVPGLLTPLAGTFETFLGALVWEGDEGISGDGFFLEANAITDALNPPDNFWNSSITRLGTRITAKNPDYVNQLAVDINYVDASGILANGATDAEIEFATDGDAYFPHALAFAVDLHTPNLVSSLAKSAVDLNGPPLMPGDVIEYTISFANSGEDGATNVVLADPIPANTAYLPGTLEILSNATGAPVGPQTDVPGDDQAEFDAIANEVLFRLGLGADASNGGLVPSGEDASVRFQVQVDDDSSLSGATISNTATVTHNAQTIPGLDFSGDADADLVVSELADLAVEKTVDNPEPLIGDTVTFTIVVTNHGPADTTGVVAEDVLPSGYTFVAAVAGQGSYDDGSGLWLIGDLDNGDSATLTIQVIVNETGDYLNTVTVDSDLPDPDLDNNESSAVTDPLAVPELTLAKSADPGSYSQAGDTIDYSFTVENTGNVTLDNVSVDDPMLGGMVSCTPNLLAPGETAACGPVTHIVTQQDVDNGEIFNAATASATDPDGGPVADDDDLIVPGPASGPALQVIKALTDAPDPIELGSLLTYTITATNTGNVTLTNVVVSDPMLSPDSATCASVTPGNDCVLAGTRAVTQDDIDNGQIVNTGVGDSDQTDPEEDTVTTPIEQQPDLTLIKLADPMSYDAVGDLIEYSFIVENTGNVTLTNVSVNDPLLGGIVACNPDELAPGETADCGPASYTVTQQDIDGGSIVNVATGAGTPPPTDSDPDPVPIMDDDTVTVTGPVGVPALEVVKTLIDAPDPIVAGSVLAYRVTATNTGTVTLTDVVVGDAMIMPDSVTCTTVPVGGTCVLEGTYTVIQADVDNGQIVNIGTGTGNPPDNSLPPVEDEAELSTPVTAVGPTPEPIAVPLLDRHLLVLLALLILLFGGLARLKRVPVR